ncbi:MAG: PilZ domain-containing protein [Gemmataceae bacterium]
MGLGRNIALTVLDVSETGVRLLVDRPLEPGEEVEVNLEVIVHRHAFRLRANVVWCLAVEYQGCYCKGIAIRRQLPCRTFQEM